MNILDILIAKKQSFSGQTERLTKQAKKAMRDANEVVSRVTAVEDAVTSAQFAAEAASSAAIAAAAEFDDMKADITSAAAAIVDEAIDNKIDNLNYNAVSEISFSDSNTNSVKIKQASVTKDDTTTSYNIVKNYTATGTNEDGSMTQKAITNALISQKYELEQKINNSSSGGGNGNVIGSFSSEDAGKLASIDNEGHLIASSINEEDIMKLQIAVGTLTDESIIGVEIDYANRTMVRIQGAVGLNSGEDFNKFEMYGGRKRCIVDEYGQITKFLTSEDTIESVADQRIMVYQPSVYYYRIPIATVHINNGVKIIKEQLFITDTPHAGFKIHPLFKDSEGNILKYVLLPAYESCALRANGSFEKSDVQNINFSTDKLVSIVNAKPISGYTQNFNYNNATQMAHNNGEGWDITDLRYESLQQMLMIVEFCSLNMQNDFNKGVSNLTSSYDGSKGCYTGATHSLLNTSGQASESTFLLNNTVTYTTEGLCSINYRGVENPYGNMWRIIGGVVCNDQNITYNNKTINFKLASTDNWVDAFGYDEQHDWVFLPIETGNGANSNVPIGDYLFSGSSQKTTSGLAGGFSTSKENVGLFYYAFDNDINMHYRSVSARVMHIPTANSFIETANYELWSNL